MADLRAEAKSNNASRTRVDTKLEAVVIPVSNVDRAKEFYLKLGWRLDADFPFDNGGFNGSTQHSAQTHIQ
jgi:catechol 2,3-dioxygenase-like lactoylglutathione lyase family enzyme